MFGARPNSSQAGQGPRSLASRQLDPTRGASTPRVSECGMRELNPSSRPVIPSGIVGSL